MQVSLYSWTNDPVETMMLAFANMHFDIPLDLETFKREQIEKHGDKWPIIRESFIELLAANPHNTVLEYVVTNWVIKGGSRAFQQQLTRTRLAAYSIQSLRIVPLDEGAFDVHTPPKVERDEALNKLYNQSARDALDYYHRLIEGGASTEDARGVLPLNTCSPITMSINLRSLSHTMGSRMCYLAQAEIREFSDLVVNEVVKKLGREFSPLFKRPCESRGECPMPVYCGRMPYPWSGTYKSMNLADWLKG
jgi:flavin-dependent thymidylate synthase